jgi:hypothetical protein
VNVSPPDGRPPGALVRPPEPDAPAGKVAGSRNAVLSSERFSAPLAIENRSETMSLAPVVVTVPPLSRNERFRPLAYAASVTTN